MGCEYQSNQWCVQYKNEWSIVCVCAHAVDAEVNKPPSPGDMDLRGSEEEERE